MNETEDQFLKDLIMNVVSEYQNEYLKLNNSKSIPLQLYSGTKSNKIAKLISYCEQNISTKKPEWMILAEKHGWEPKQ